MLLYVYIYIYLYEAHEKEIEGLSCYCEKPRPHLNRVHFLVS